MNSEMAYSQKAFYCIVLYTNIASVTSEANPHFRNKNTWSDDLKHYVWRLAATRILKLCLK